MGYMGILLSYTPSHCLSAYGGTIVPIYYSSFHFLFHYPYVAPKPLTLLYLLKGLGFRLEK